MYHRSQNDAGEGASPKRLVSLSWGKKGLVETWTELKYENWEVDWSF